MVIIIMIIKITITIIIVSNNFFPGRGVPDFKIENIIKEKNCC